MATIRCSNCNLVNFETETQCRRCRQPLQRLSNLADQRQYQTAFEQELTNPPPQFQSYQMPPPPTFYQNQNPPAIQQTSSSCIKCGDRNSISVQGFKKHYVPPYIYLGIFLGVLPVVILILILRTSHHVNAPFCHACWNKFRKVNTVETLASLGTIFGFLVGLFAAVIAQSLFVFLFFTVLTLALFVYGQSYRIKNSPKFKKISRKEVVITDPVYGDVSFAR